MTRELGGVLGPITTTFHAETGDLEPVSLRRSIAHHLDAGLDGIVVGGSTGEAALLDEDERTNAIAAAREAVPADRWLLAGTGAESTRQAVARCVTAARLGADAVLVVAPHYYGAAAMTQDALRVHYRRVADESPRPVVLYNIPKYAHLTLSPELVAELAEHENVIGIKDSSGDHELLTAYLRSQSAAFSVLTGNGGGWCRALEAGCRGGILAVALFVPALTIAIREAVAAGELEVARAAQERLTIVAREIVAGLGVAGVKAAQQVVGIEAGEVRGPLLPLDRESRARIRELLTAAELESVA